MTGFFVLVVALIPFILTSIYFGRQDAKLQRDWQEAWEGLIKSRNELNESIESLKTSNAELKESLDTSKKWGLYNEKGMIELYDNPLKAQLSAQRENRMRKTDTYYIKEL